MALLVSDVGEIEALARILAKNQSPNKLVLHLYSNDKTPSEGDNHTNYTECAGTGYAPIDIIGSGWAISTTAGVTKAEYAMQSFNFSGAEANIYGYYITTLDAGSNVVLLWAQRFVDGPYHVPSGGGVVKITPRIELD
jgi:hypothetical protein